MTMIEYDPLDYTVLDTIEIEDSCKFQKVKFTTGYYGVLFIVPEYNLYDVMLIGTYKDEESQVNLFMEYARNQTSILNHMRDGIDEVELHIHLNEDYSEVFKEVVSKEQSDDLIERMKICNEIIELNNIPDYSKVNQVLTVMLIGLVLLNLVSVFHLYGIGGL